MERRLRGLVLMGIMAGCAPVQFDQASVFSEQVETAATVPDTGSHRSLSANPLLEVTQPALLNSTSMTWDGRVVFGGRGVVERLIPSEGTRPVFTRDSGELALSSGQSIKVNGLSLAMQGDCNLILYDTSAGSARAVWASGTGGKCTNPQLAWQGDGNLVVLGTDVETGKFASIWAANSNGTRHFEFYRVAPFLLGTAAEASQVLTMKPGFRLDAREEVHATSGGKIYRLSMQGDCNLVYTVDKVPVWASGTDRSTCRRPSFAFQADGNLVVYDDGTAIWAAASNGAAAAYLHAGAPFLSADTIAGERVYSAQRPNILWSAQQKGLRSITGSVFRSSYLNDPSRGASDKAAALRLLNDSFAPAHDLLVNPTNFETQNTTFPSINDGHHAFRFPFELGGLAVGRDGDRADNPYRSDKAGNERSDGDYETYKLRLLTNAGDVCKAASGDARDGTGMMTFSATLVVVHPGTDASDIAAFRVDTAPTPIIASDGHHLCGIEPSMTADGQILIINPNDIAGVSYAFNPQPSRPVTGWLALRKLSLLHTDALNNPVLGAKGYGLARYPMRDTRGLLYTEREPDPMVWGAYPWISPDGADAFFTTVRDEDGSTRAGEAAFGASTFGELRILDGASNLTRNGGLPRRLIVSSFGRMPGMWSPLDTGKRKVFPLTDKLGTYPFFATFGTHHLNAGSPAWVGAPYSTYYEASFEEALSRDYEVYMEMQEGLSRDHGLNVEYDLAVTPDGSGNFHFGRLNTGASFPEEAFNFGAASVWFKMTNGVFDRNPQTGNRIASGLPPTQAPDNTCGLFSCPLKDPNFQDSKHGNQPANFTGGMIFFRGDGALTVDATSPTGHVLLANTHDLSVSFAIKPRFTTNTNVSLLTKDGVLNLWLGPSNRIGGAIRVRTGSGSGSDVTVAIGSIGPSLAVDEWTHVGLVFNTKTGQLIPYFNGVAGDSRTLDQMTGHNLAFNAKSNLMIGPNGTSTSSDFLYALDQVAVSGVVRTSLEMMRQAQRVLPRDAKVELPEGLGVQDVKSPLMLSGLDKEGIALGSSSSPSKTLSNDGSRSCATCHFGDSLAEAGVKLHASKLKTGPQHLLRNTPGLLNLAFNESFFRDGRAPTLSDQAHEVILNTNEMGNSSMTSVVTKVAADTKLLSYFKTAYPGQSSPVTTEHIQKALEKFELSLASATSRFDLYRAGDLSQLSADEVRGKGLFFGKARCAECHAGTAFTDSQFHALPFVPLANADGVTDLGRQAVTGSPVDLSRFRTPSLRSVELTAPYFHNGSVAKLEDVVHLYNSVTSPLSGTLAGRATDDRLMPIGLTADEEADLVLFLKSLTGLPPDTAP